MRKEPKLAKLLFLTLSLSSLTLRALVSVHYEFGSMELWFTSLARHVTEEPEITSLLWNTLINFSVHLPVASTEGAARFLPVVLFSFFVWQLYREGRDTGGASAGLLAVFLAHLIPFILLSGCQLWATAFLLFYWITMMRMLGEDASVSASGKTRFCAVLTGLAMHVHGYAFLALIPPLFLFSTGEQKQKRRAFYIWSLLSMLVFTLPVSWLSGRSYLHSLPGFGTELRSGEVAESFFMLFQVPVLALLFLVLLIALFHAEMPEKMKTSAKRAFVWAMLPLALFFISVFRGVFAPELFAVVLISFLPFAAAQMTQKGRKIFFSILLITVTLSPIRLYAEWVLKEQPSAREADATPPAISHSRDWFPGRHAFWASLSDAMNSRKKSPTFLLTENWRDAVYSEFYLDRSVRCLQGSDRMLKSWELDSENLGHDALLLTSGDDAVAAAKALRLFDEVRFENRYTLRGQGRDGYGVRLLYCEKLTQTGIGTTSKKISLKAPSFFD